MEISEKIAREICARAHQGGFCDCVGESMGCKVGRGESGGEHCAANRSQLILAGYETTADAILALPEIAEALAAFDHINDTYAKSIESAARSKPMI